MFQVPGSGVRKEGLEPPYPFGYQILSLARLPVPPLSRLIQPITVNGSTERGCEGARVLRCEGPQVRGCEGQARRAAPCGRLPAMSATQVTHKSPPPAVWRWAVLVAISVAMFGNYYVYDSIAPVADSLQRLLGFTDTQIGMLNAIYSLPNIVVVLIGGVIVDRFGTRLSTLLFAIICSVGAVVTAISPSFPVMAAGRLIFGLGAESMIVAITVAIGQWFVGRQLGFAFGVNLSIARAGSYSADYSTTLVQAVVRPGLAATALARRRDVSRRGALHASCTT